jgi:hypothetical protein
MYRKFVLISDLDHIEKRFNAKLNPHTLPISGPLASNGELKTYVKKSNPETQINHNS